MNFIGTGRRLAANDIGDAARAIGIETAVLLAFIEVEAAGRGFDSKNRPKMLFEPHVFWRNLAGALRDQAVRVGLAHQKWVAGRYPADSYPRLNQAIAISKEPALRSASWGLPQILGENFKAAGFASAELMVKAMMQGEREQLLAMVAFLKAEGFLPLLVGKDFTKAASWAPIARKYNGRAYATHNYHGRMAVAYIKHSKGDSMVIPAPAFVILREGMKGEAVRNLQADLRVLGLNPGPVDGRFGPQTTAAVRMFQSLANIGTDGIVGEITLRALSQAMSEVKEDKSPPPSAWDGQGETPSSKPNVIALVVVAIAVAIAAAFGINLNQ